MMNKKKLCIIIVIAIIVTGLAVTFAVLSKSGKHKESVNAESTVNNEKQTDSETEAAKADERKQVQTSVTMQFKQFNSWEGNGRFYAQYSESDVSTVQLIHLIQSGVSCRLIIIR